jgi:signal transduction histidine kinase
MAHIWPSAQAIVHEKKNEIRRFLRRAVYSASHADIVRRFEASNKRTPFHLFVAIIVAATLYRVSTFSPSIIVIWLLWMVATDLFCHLLRTLVIRRAASRLDVPIYVALTFFLNISWSAMPVILEFRSPVEMFIGAFVLAGILISIPTTRAWAPFAFLRLAMVAGAMLIPEIANLFSHKPHGSALAILVIKLLFLLNFSSLVRSWYAGAKREADMREELEKRRQQAEELAATKALFLAHMSHEIRSPLAGVTLMASLLKRLEDVPENQRQLIEQIDAGGQVILNLLNTVLDYSKIEAGKVRLSPVPTDIRALLDSVISFFEYRAREANIRLSLSVHGVLPSALMLDETRLRQILTNLVSNAIKHSPAATVLLTVGYEDSSQTLLLEVIDTGRGVNEKMKKQLFAPYEQHAGADSGTGLGLAISHGLTNLMAGKIGFRDTQGGGATFWIRIPAPRVAGDFPFRPKTDVQLANA